MGRTPQQLSLFQSKMTTAKFQAGDFRRKEAVKEAARRALSGWDRDAVAKELSRLVGEEISIHTLNNYLADGRHNRRLPLEIAEALSAITGDWRILQAGCRLARVLTPDEVPIYEMGELAIAQKKTRKAAVEIDQRLKAAGIL